MDDRATPPTELFPLSASFEDVVAERLRNSSAACGDWFSGNAFELLTSLPQGPFVPCKPTLQNSATVNATFFAIAARAYQEAVKLPEEAPPSVWAPGDPLHSYYEQILYRFRFYFRDLVGHRGPVDEKEFQNEWLQHSRSIMDNIRAQWGLHALGSTTAFKTFADTPNLAAAMLSLQKAVTRPTDPPPADYQVGDRLHPYYEGMLVRFEWHVKIMLETYRLPVFSDPAHASEFIDEFELLIIRHYRETWLSMFGTDTNN